MGNSYSCTALAICLGLLAAGSAFAQSDQEPPTANIVIERFEPPSEDWQVISGVWSFVDGTYRSRGGGATDISRIISYRDLHPAAPPRPTLSFPNYTYRGRVFHEGGPAGSEIGLVFGYRDPTHYHEVVFSTSGVLGGMLRLRRVVNGFAETVNSAGLGGTILPRTWYEIEVQVNERQEITVKLDGRLYFDDENFSENLSDGQIGVVSHGAVGRFDQLWVGTPFGDQPFKEDFNDGDAPNWSPQSGQWAVASGTYNNAAVEQTSVTLAPITTAIRSTITYTLRARMLNPYGASGNLVGIVFNYRGPLNYSELVFSPLGIARINDVTNGVRTTLASTTYNGRRNTWFDVRFENVFAVTVRVDGELIFENVPANPGIAPDGGVGLITHWAPGRFDDVWFDHGGVGSGICTENFSSEPLPGHIVSGSWDAQGGTLNSTAVGETDIAAGFCAGGEDVTYRLRLLNQFGASGNRIGVIFSYQTSSSLYWGDYFEVVFSPTGIAQLRKVIHGVRYVVASSTHNIPRNVWFDVEVIRNGIDTTVRANGQTLFENVPLGGLPGGNAGAVTHWSRARFDDFSAVQQLER
jgi:hypothetical protein